MKPSDQVSVEVGLTGGHVILNVPHKIYEEFKKEVRKKSKDWLTIALEHGAEFELNIPAVQYLRMRPQGVRALSSKGGLTLVEIADILGEPYQSFRQRIKRHNIHLETGAGRRVFLNLQALKDFQEHLDVDPKKIEKLKGHL